jgi:hypothetical protein
VLDSFHIDDAEKKTKSEVREENKKQINKNMLNLLKHKLEVHKLEAVKKKVERKRELALSVVWVNNDQKHFTSEADFINN